MMLSVLIHGARRHGSASTRSSWPQHASLHLRVNSLLGSDMARYSEILTDKFHVSQFRRQPFNHVTVCNYRMLKPNVWVSLIRRTIKTYRVVSSACAGTGPKRSA